MAITTEAAGGADLGGAATDPPPRGATKPGWLPFWVVIGIFVLLALVMTSIGVFLPQQAEGTVGFYQRVALEETSDGVTVTVGFIAPEGWSTPIEDGESDEGEEEEETPGEKLAKRVTFTSPDDSLQLTATAHANTAGPQALLRQSAPVGAALLPTVTVPLESGLTGQRLSYDLDAGSGRVDDVAVCGVVNADNCVLLRLTVADGATFDGDLPAEFVTVLQSVEVY